MDRVTLGRSGLKVSPICVGAWELGADWGAADAASATTAIQLAREHGVNCFDTAPDLGLGPSAQLVGAALDEDLREDREDVVIATEGGLRREGDRMVRDARPEWLRQDVDASLSALGVDVIDLYQVNWPDPNTPVEETADGLAELIEDGKIRHAGLSILDPPTQLVAMAQHGSLETLETSYHLFRRGIEGLWLPYSQAHDIGVLADGPLADGLLGGPMSPSSMFGTDDWRSRLSSVGGETAVVHRTARMRRPAKGGTTRPVTSHPGYGFGRPLRPDRDRTLRRNLAVMDALQKFAADREISLPELAVAWTLANPAVDVAVVGARNPDHLHDTFGAVDVRLSRRDLAEIDWILGDPYRKE
jgi:aryl-alcohol dehydrogenase-like predicted oxidoreductase